MSRSIRRRYSRSPSPDSRGSMDGHSRYKRHRASPERYVHSRGEYDDRHSRAGEESDYFQEYSPDPYGGTRSRYRHHSSEKKRKHHHHSRSPPPTHVSSNRAYSPERSPPPRRSRYSCRSPSRSPRPRSRSAERYPRYDDDDDYEDEPCEVGCIIKNRYKIIETLGDSTFSKVVQAYDLEKKQVIALEIVKNMDKARDRSRGESKPAETTPRPGGDTNSYTYQFNSFAAYPGMPPNPMFGYPASAPFTPAITQAAPFPGMPPYPPNSYPPGAAGAFPRLPPPPPPGVGAPYFPPHWNPPMRPPPTSIAGPRGPTGVTHHTNHVIRNNTPPHIANALAKFRNEHPHLFLGRNQAPRPQIPVVRSKLLEDMRNSDFSDVSLLDVKHHIVEFSQDQNGSRFIQQKLKKATPEEQELVFEEILNQAYDLMQNMFGNYVIQKFFEHGAPEHRETLVAKMKGHVLNLSFNIYGCRVIQKALEAVPLECQLQIVRELDGFVIDCVKDQNGNHVIQKAIECVDPESISFIVNAFRGRIFEIGCHPYGCRVVQKLFTYCTPTQMAPLLQEFHDGASGLMQNVYGNYVAQHVLEHGSPEDRSKVVAQILGKVLRFAQHKFASNVVEKCVTHASRGERTLLIEEVCSSVEGPNSPLCQMVRDQYGNYVVQKMLELATESQCQRMVEKLRPHMNSLARSPFGRHFFMKMKKYFETEEGSPSPK